jgi:DNA-binding FadR family transcriptional regulator
LAINHRKVRELMSMVGKKTKLKYLGHLKLNLSAFDTIINKMLERAEDDLLFHLILFNQSQNILHKDFFGSFKLNIYSDFSFANQ